MLYNCFSASSPIVRVSKFSEISVTTIGNVNRSSTTTVDIVPDLVSIITVQFDGYAVHTTLLISVKAFNVKKKHKDLP